MDYEWDPLKAKSNARKHGVEFAEAVIALEDTLAITIKDPDSEGEERFVSVGVDSVGRLLNTVFTFRENSVRIISSRKATKRERMLYESHS